MCVGVEVGWNSQVVRVLASGSSSGFNSWHFEFFGAGLIDGAAGKRKVHDRDLMMLIELILPWVMAC